MTGTHLGSLLVALLLVAGCGGHGESQTTTSPPRPTSSSSAGTTTEPPPPPARCTTPEGNVDGYLPVIERDRCEPRRLLLDETLFAADRLSTGLGGRLDFHTAVIDQCTMREDAAVFLRPTSSTALRLVSGTIVCQITPGPEVRLESPGAEIEVRGTLFSLSATADGTTIKVRDGELFARSTAEPRSTATVSAENQVFAPVAGALGRLSTLAFADSLEKDLFDAVRLDVVSVPSAEIDEFLASRHRTSGAVLTQTKEQGKVVTSQNPAVQLVPFTVEAVRAGSVRRSRRSIDDTVIGVGSFSALLPAFEQLRAELGETAVLAYAPSDFSAKPPP
jgi:hypothetical protein